MGCVLSIWGVRWVCRRLTGLQAGRVVGDRTMRIIRTIELGRGVRQEIGESIITGVWMVREVRPSVRSGRVRVGLWRAYIRPLVWSAS
jgi:hypothetical protein